MNIENNPSLMDQLAASYALGTLRGGARRRFETLARNNPTLRAAALIWQSRLGGLAELQPQAAPSPAVWKRIENLVQADKQSQAMQDARAAVAVAPTRSLWNRLGLWQGATALATFATVVAVVTGMQMMTQLNGQVTDLTAQLSGNRDIQYMAVLSDDKSAAAMLVTFDRTQKKMMLRRMGSFQEGSDKSLELWALPPGGAPRSLGVLTPGRVARMNAAMSDVKEVPMLAVTLEPKGGVPRGSGPTGPILFKGALLKTAV